MSLEMIWMGAAWPIRRAEGGPFSLSLYKNTEGAWLFFFIFVSPHLIGHAAFICIIPKLIIWRRCPYKICPTNYTYNAWCKNFSTLRIWSDLSINERSKIQCKTNKKDGTFIVHGSLLTKKQKQNKTKENYHINLHMISLYLSN